MSGKLLKCPFCGVELEFIKRKKGDIYHHPWNECIARAWYFDAHNKRCIKLWNTRTPMQRVLERLEADKEQAHPVERQTIEAVIEIIKEEGMQ